MDTRPINPRRNKAFLIDFIIYLLGIVLPLLLVGALPTWLGGKAAACGIAFSLFYIVFRDGFNGQSIGKRFFKIQIVHRKTRKPIGFRMAFLRGILTSLPVLGWIDFLQTVFTLNGQRLSDKFLGTMLIATDEPMNSVTVIDLVPPLPKRSQKIGNRSIYVLLAVGLAILVCTGPCAYNYRRSPQTQKRALNAVLMKQVAICLDSFQHICGHFPTTQQGLKALTVDLSKSDCSTPNTAPLMVHVPVDVWDQQFEYESDGKKFALEALGELKAQHRGQKMHLETGWVDPKVVE